MEENNVNPMSGEGTVQTAPEEKKRKFGLKAILVAVAAVTVAAAVTVGISVASSPVKLIGVGLANSAKALSESSASVFWGKVAKGGSMELAYSMDEMNLPVDVDAALKLYTAVGKAALVADVRFDGESLIDASVFADKENIAVESQLLFGKRAYGVSLVDFEERFNNSVFGPGGEFSLGIEAPKRVDSAANDMDALLKEGLTIRENMASQLITSLKEHAQISKERTTVTVNAAAVPVTAVKAKVTGEAAVEVIIDLIEYLQSDVQLKEFLYDYADYMQMPMMDADIDEFYAQLEEIGDEEKMQLRESAVKTQIEFVLTCYITRSGKELIGVDLDGAADGDNISMSFLAGPTWKKLDEISFSVEADGEKFSASYVVDRDDGEYSAKLKVHENGESLFDGTFEWDKEREIFVAEMTDDWGDTYAVTGSLKADVGMVVVTVDSVCDDYGEVPLGLSLVVDASDMMPEMPVYAELLDMDADEVEAVLYSIEETLEALGYMFF